MAAIGIEIISNIVQSFGKSYTGLYTENSNSVKLIIWKAGTKIEWRDEDNFRMYERYPNKNNEEHAWMVVNKAKVYMLAQTWPTKTSVGHG